MGAGGMARGRGEGEHQREAKCIAAGGVLAGSGVGVMRVVAGVC